MTITALLSDLIARGVEFQAHGDKLRFRPSEKLTAGDIENIRRYKPAMLAMLRGEGFVYRNPDADPRPLNSCDRCGSAEHTDVPILGGRSLRRDCTHCHRFLGWPRWYGRAIDTRTEDSNES